MRCVPDSIRREIARTWTPLLTSGGKLWPPPLLDIRGGPASLSNLGNSFRTRFEHSRDSADLDAAIDVGRQAVSAAPQGHADRAIYLSNLAASLYGRFDQTGNGADLDSAIDVGRQAVSAAPQGHADRTIYLSNLGNFLLTRFSSGMDLEAAIAAGSQAVMTSPPGHPYLATCLFNLGQSLHDRFRWNGDMAELEAAIDTERLAVAATEAEHPNMAMFLQGYGNCMKTFFGQTGKVEHLDAALGCWQLSSQVSAGAPGTRLSAARSWGAAAAQAGRIHAAAKGYTAAVKLLPTVAWHGLDRGTREEQLGQWSGLATDAAAFAVLDDHPQRAVELLEQGRSVLWTQALNLRSDLARLAERDPRLAERLDHIRKSLDNFSAGSTLGASELGDHRASVIGIGREELAAADLSRRMARDWDNLLAEVRTLEGFEHFLSMVPYLKLAGALINGPVVILNVSRYGCHALIAEAGSKHPQVVNLPDITFDSAVDQANKMLAALSGIDQMGPFLQQEKARHAVLDVLSWLWDVVAEPVLRTLGYRGTPRDGNPWPRIWWCPTGPLTALPIHAAGNHPRHRITDTGNTDCVFDRVISSYTPTLTALTRVQQPRTSAPLRHLGVGMPTTPEQLPLPSVLAELKVLARHFPPGQDNHQLAGSQATCAAASAAVADHTWIHMACHARQEHADPDRSGFALWDGTLNLTDLAALPTGHRDLAFLSACQTATGSFRHLDEAIHLAAAMQFLGYQHVIATMWTIADSPAPRVADKVYTTLLEGDRPEAAQTALALHRAIRSLRLQDPTNPLLWASYIHLGPWTAPSFLEAVTSGKVGTHAITEAASR